MKLEIVDYGLGNLFNVKKAFESIGASPRITESPEDVAGADAVVLPGVGAFGDGMQGLRQRGLVEPLRAFAASGRPLLGICLGMQLMMSESEEFGTHAGLELVKGRVVSLQSDPAFSAKVPHVGWSRLKAERPWDGTVLRDLPVESEVYFVHSFRVVPHDPSLTLASTQYGGADICAVIQKDNLVACQFHPEKSREAGIAILGSMLRLALLPPK